MCNQRENNSGPPILHTQTKHSLALYLANLHQEAPVIRSIKKWSDEADAKLQDCFPSTDWNMFRDSSNGIEEYTTSVIGFINKCIDHVVPTLTVRTVHTQTRNHGLQATSALS